MKTIFITGGSTGIGRATVRKFVGEGWNVAFVDINTEDGERLAQELGEKVLFARADTRNRSEVEAAVEAAVARFGGIDSVFTNAGIHRVNTILDISDEELHRMVDINIFGTINTLQAVLPRIISRGGGSAVLNCSDQWYVGKPHSFAYGMTKGAVGQIVRSLSIDMGEHGIRVNGVCAGSINTPLLDGALQGFADLNGTTYEAMAQGEHSLYARGRYGEPEEVANLVFFLASDQASFCTGGHYLVDGGLVAK